LESSCNIYSKTHLIAPATSEAADRKLIVLHPRITISDHVLKSLNESLIGKPMQLDQTIQQHVARMPLPLQGEVLDFVLFLEQKSRCQPSVESERRTALESALEKTVTLDPFAGVDPVK
jgi:hypothetical protein